MTLYEFHKASIHERRFAAKLCAAFPLLVFLGYFALLGYGIVHHPPVLLYTCAIMNVATWYWLSSTMVLAIVGVFFTSEALQQAEVRRPKAFVRQGEALENGSVCTDMTDKVMHLIVLPNMKEDEGMLAETLQSLSEADDSDCFCVVLAMEDREKCSFEKGQRLKERFQQLFGGVTVSVHPSNLEEAHLDNSVDAEVPGKASNLKWAVPHGFADFVKSGLIKSPSSVILTVADVDCIFHPGYFHAVSREFNKLRENPGNDHMWTMYQAPQLPSRNFFSAIAPCRILGYISSAFEFGGVTSLSFGGHHTTFSGYSLPLQLAMDAGAWDGDVIAEDAHAFLKCFLYSSLTSAKASSGVTAVSQLHVQPMYLPVKATSVAAESYWSTCVNRWSQAKRHAQGVSELSYALLAIWDALYTLPWRSHSFAFYIQMARVLGRLICTHLLPTCQGVGLFALSLVWIYHGGRHPLCSKHFTPSYLTHLNLRANHHLVCGLAGAWVTYVPVFTLTCLLIAANYLFLSVVFLRDKKRKAIAESIWHGQDGGAPIGGTGQHLLALLQITFDCILLLSVVMVPYGFFATSAAYIDCALHGNRVRYINARKPISRYVSARKPLSTYGTLSATDDRSTGSVSLATSTTTGSERNADSSGAEEPLTP